MQGGFAVPWKCKGATIFDVMRGGRPRGQMHSRYFQSNCSRKVLQQQFEEGGKILCVISPEKDVESLSTGKAIRNVLECFLDFLSPAYIGMRRPSEAWNLPGWGKSFS